MNGRLGLRLSIDVIPTVVGGCVGFGVAAADNGQAINGCIELLHVPCNTTLSQLPGFGISPSAIMLSKVFGETPT